MTFLKYIFILPPVRVTGSWLEPRQFIVALCELLVQMHLGARCGLTALTMIAFIFFFA